MVQTSRRVDQDAGLDRVERRQRPSTARGVAEPSANASRYERSHRLPGASRPWVSISENARALSALANA